MLTRKMIVGMIMMVLVSMSGVGWAAEYWVHPGPCFGWLLGFNAIMF